MKKTQHLIASRNTHRAFTLIELLVVISIIGMLSSVVLVSLSGARDKAVKARIQQSVGQARNALEIARTNTGYPSLQSSTNNFAFYGNLPSDLKLVVDDILKQLGTTVASGYVGGAANCSATSITPNLSTAGVVVTTNATACGNVPTEYAVYSAVKPIGTGGFICQDSKGGKYSATTGGIVPNDDAGACEGTVVSGGGGPDASVSLSYVGSVQNVQYRDFEVSWISVGTVSILPCEVGFSSNPGDGPYQEPQNMSSAGSILVQGLDSFYLSNGITTVTIACYTSGANVTDQLDLQI